MKNAIKVILLVLFAHTSYADNSATNDYRSLVVRAANELGASGYGKCAAATISLLAMKTRGDNLGRLAPKVDPMVNFMGDVRTLLLGKGMPESTLDNLLKQHGRIILSDKDPGLRAMMDFDKCFDDAVR